MKFKAFLGTVTYTLKKILTGDSPRSGRRWCCRQYRHGVQSNS